MDRLIEPLAEPPNATVVIPGSKSLTNRALVTSLLATGTSTLSGVLFADDTEAMLDAIVALGATVRIDRSTHTVEVDGVAGSLAAGPVVVDARQSGTTARFLAAVLTLGHGEYRLDADPQMQARPMGDLTDALAQVGTRTESIGEADRLPLAVHANGGRGGLVHLPGHVSSQFASALLLAGPYLADGLTLRLSTEPVSMPYLNMTMSVMTAFGADVRRDGDGAGTVFSVAPGGYRAVEYAIEPDASGASYFFAAAAMTGGRVTVDGLGSESVQGDMAFVGVLEQMGAAVEMTDASTTVHGTGSLRGVDVNLRDFSDTQPTLAVVAALAEGPTNIDGIGFIRAKESDRIGAVAAELVRLGVGAHELPDGLRVEPGPVVAGEVHTYDDHRIAMAFSLLGLTRPGITILDAGCVAKTFPTYFEVIDQLRIQKGPAVNDEEPEHDLLVIAIDGPAGSGKSTVAKAVAQRLDVPYLDTGAMYRSIAFACIQRGIDPFDDDAVAAVARDADILITDDVVRVDGIDATTEIRGPEVTRAVSAVAANERVREQLVSRQREWANRRGGGVMEGRDIGTVVFPDARLKVFLTASVEVRARRRAKEVTDLDYETVAADIVRRDAHDEGRDHSPLTQASDAITVDTSDLSIDEVVEKVASLLHDR